MATLAQILDKTAPKVLYHGSAFKQDELMPGFRHSGKLVTWDKYESNAFLYATTEKEQAKLLGIMSGIEKKYSLKHTRFDVNQKTIDLTFDGRHPHVDDIMASPVYLYTIPLNEQWKRVNNPVNGIDTEYKTSATIKELLDVQTLDVPSILADYSITFK